MTLDDSYFIDENGNVYSVALGRYVKKTLMNTGYYSVSLVIDGVRKKHLLHRLLAQKFIPNPNRFTQVNHIDGNKVNNRLDNLEWCTPSQNQLHAFKLGLKSNSHPKPSRRVSVSCVDSKGNKRTFNSITEASRSTGSLHSSINNCLKGRTKTCGGLTWHYV